MLAIFLRANTIACWRNRQFMWKVLPEFFTYIRNFHPLLLFYFSIDPASIIWETVRIELVEM